MAEAERTWMYSKRTPDSYTRLLRATNEQYNLALNSHFRACLQLGDCKQALFSHKVLQQLFPINFIRLHLQGVSGSCDIVFNERCL